jgi:hypothetical protein
LTFNEIYNKIVNLFISEKTVFSMKKIKSIIIVFLFFTVVMFTPPQVVATNTPISKTVEIATAIATVHANPINDSPIAFTLYKGMQISATEVKIENGTIWVKFTAGRRQYWLKGAEQGRWNVNFKAGNPMGTRDNYGILKRPHRYAIKLVKFPDATARMETYKHENGKYIFRESYAVSYRKEGPKSHYGDLRTVGGPVIRYMYRTTRTGMGGRNNNGEYFGAYKISFPMPHDALPHLLTGNIVPAQYNKIPAINKTGETFFPHPHSYMGADIVLHTKRKGSRGCLNIKNDRMSHFYHTDMVTENDRELIPFVIYDEGQKAPVIGSLL